MSQNSPQSKRVSSGFGQGYRGRRKTVSATPMNASANEDLIAAFLKKKPVTKCPPRHADGSIEVSGFYDF